MGEIEIPQIMWFGLDECCIKIHWLIGYANLRWIRDVSNLGIAQCLAIRFEGWC